MVYIYTLAEGAEWTPPAEQTEEAHLAHEAFAATVAIFFIDSPNKCASCMPKELLRPSLRPSL